MGQKVISPVRSVATSIVCLMLVLAAWPGAPLLTHSATAYTGSSFEIHVYSQPGCPFCQRAKDYLIKASADQSWLVVIDHDIETDPRALQEFETLNEALAITTPGVPLILAGHKVFVGFDQAATTGADVLDIAETCRGVPCRDLRSEVLSEANGTSGPTAACGDRQLLILLRYIAACLTASICRFSVRWTRRRFRCLY